MVRCCSIGGTGGFGFESQRVGIGGLGAIGGWGRTLLVLGSGHRQGQSEPAATSM